MSIKGKKLVVLKKYFDITELSLAYKEKKKQKSTTTTKQKLPNREREREQKKVKRINATKMETRRSKIMSRISFNYKNATTI